MKRAKRVALKAEPKWVCNLCGEAVARVGKGGVATSMREHRRVCRSFSGSLAGFQIKR
jgi:hypothetical protein